MKKSPTYLITGAGRGIGLQTVKFFLKNHPETKIIAISRNVEKLKSLVSTKGKLKIIQADITKGVPEIVSKLKKEKLNGILNNAGLLIKKDFQKLNIQDFSLIYNTNVFAPFNLTKSLIANMASNAHVVNIGSMGGYENTIKYPGMIFYSSSKAALHCLSQCLSVELEKYKISVNCISMGSVETDMVKQAFPGFKPPITDKTMAEFMSWFLQNGQKFFKGQIIPVALTTP